jgi:hypothetical protein
MPAWSDRRTWQAMRDVEQSYWFRLAKGIVQPIEASGQEPNTDMDTGLPVGAPVSERPSGPAEPSCPVVPLTGGQE